MSDSSFDPYHVWLGIAPDEQPADHYRLLGIRRFESNPDVIASAADRQMAHLKSFQIGARANDCQRLLNIVSAAAACLLDAQRKEAYDASIRPVATVPVVSGKKPNRPQTYPVTSMVQIVLGGALGLFVAVLTLNYFWGIDILGKAKKTEPVAEVDKVREPQKKEPEPREVASPALVKSSELDPVKVPTNAAKHKIRPVKPAKVDTPPPPKAEIVPAPPTSPRTLATPPPEPPVPSGPPISILERIPPLPLMAGGITPGKWEMIDGKLEGHEGGVMLPVEVPQDYQLDLTVEHLMKDGFFVLGIVVAGQQTEIVMDWETGGSHVTGFHRLDGQAADNNETTYRGPLFQSSRPCQLRCIVRGNYVQFLADEKVIIQWRGDPGRLIVSHDWAVPDRQSLFVTSTCTFRISRIELTPFASSLPAKRKPQFALAPARRLPPATGKDLQQARAAVRKLFAKEFAAINSVGARRSLSQALLARVKEDRDDITIRFALLLEAHDLARNALDPSGACQAIEEQARTFELDSLALQTAVVEGVAKEHTVKSAPVDLLATASTASIYLNKTLLVERLELAVRLAAVLRRIAVLERSAELKEYANRRTSEVTLAKQLFDAMSPVRGEIGEESKSAAANLAVGRYECFVRGNWPEGLLLLSRGSDKPLAEVAALELATDFRRYRAVADSWWKLSESEAEPWRTEYRQQAKYWYEKVSPELSTLERQGKILNVKGVARNRLAAGLLGAYYQGDNRDILRTTRIEKRVYFPLGWGNGSPEATIPRDHFSASWSGFIQAPIPGKYRLLVDSDDGSSLSLNGKSLWDEVGGGAGVRSAVADFTGDPQRLEVRYHEGVGTTHCVLRWGLADGTGDQLVDETLLRHDPQLAREMRVKEVFGYYPDLVSVPSAPDGGLLAIFEDQAELPTILTEGSGIGTMEGNDCYSGNASLRIVDDQRFRTGIPDFRQRIRENPGPGEYRYFRLAWKKTGGKVIGLQILTQSKPGASDTFFEWKRYHIGPSPDVFPLGGASIRIGELIPEEWSVITRDLFADYGEFDLTGIALSPCDGVHGLFDHIYLARRLEDFDRLGK